MSLVNRDIARYCSEILKPRPNVTGTEFVKEYFYAQNGKITPYPWQEEILNRCMDATTEKISIIKPSRVGYTEVIIGARIAYSIMHDPSNILIAQPTDDEAYGYAEDNLQKLIENNEEVKRLIATAPIVGKKKKERTVKKNFPGGWVEVVGAHSPKNFRRRSAKVAIADEIDGWVIGAGDEGDQLSLLERRTADYYDGKVIVGSTPTIKGKSRIEELFLAGDRNERYYPCPSCGNMHRWHIDFLKYDTDEDGIVDKESVRMSCEHCGYMYAQDMQHELDAKGKFIAEKEFRGHASYRINGFMSRSPKTTWYHIAQAYEYAKKDKAKLMQPFMNTILGYTYEEDRNDIDDATLRKRKEPYEHEVPDNVKVLIMSVDTQNDRLEWNVIGYAENMETYLIDRGIIYGDPAQRQPWIELDEIFNRKTYESSDGGMEIYAMGIDSGGGRTVHVYGYCNPRLHQRVYALKGSSLIDSDEVSRRIVKDKGSVHYGTTYFSVGVNRIKDIVSVGLRNEFGRYHVHFPQSKKFDKPYFEQLVAEYKNDKGRWVVRSAGLRNEAFDLLVYGYATLLISGYDLNSERATKKIDDSHDVVEVDEGF